MSRKEKKYHFIYKTTNLLNNKYYIGMHSTDNLEDGYLGSGKRLRYSIRKHGAENHQREILEFCESRLELKNREEEIVSLNEIAKVECMNLMVGGQGGFISDEQQRHRSQCGGKALKERVENDPELRRKYQESGRKNFIQAHKDGKIKYDTFTGKTHSNETKKKMSESMKGKNLGSKNGSFGTCWITNCTENKKIKKEDLFLWETKGFKKGRE